MKRRYEMANNNVCTTRKQLKSGTVNCGYEYEKVVPAYFALKLLEDESIKSFTIDINTRSFQKFDDITISVTTIDNVVENFAIQLKHKEEGRDCLQANEEFQKIDSRGKPKDFNISGYKQSFEKLSSNIKAQYNFILFTNVTFKYTDQVSNYDVVRPSESFNCHFLNDDGYIYQIKNKNAHNQNDNFYKKFYILSSQKNVKIMQNSIMKIITDYYCSTPEKATCFIDLFNKIHTGAYNTNSITRDQVIVHLTKLLCSSHEILPSIHEEQCEKTHLIRKLLQNFDLILLPDINPSLIKHKWKDFIPEDSSKFVEDLVEERKFLFEKNPLNQKIIRTILCFSKKTPMFLNFTEDFKDTVCVLIKLLKTLEIFKITLVLIGEDLRKSKHVFYNTFENLEQLSNTEVYQDFINSFTLSLQGRKPQTMAALKQIYGINLEQFITPNQIFQSLENDLTIGKELNKLPIPYISRTLLKENLHYLCLEDLCKQKITIINCDGKSKEFKHLLEDTQFKFDIVGWDGYKQKFEHCNNKLLILLDKPLKEHRKKNFYHLTLMKDNFLKWDDSKVTAENQEIFDNQLNVIYGNPGIGKTTMIDYLGLNSPPRYWVVIVSLQQVKSLFDKKKQSDTILQDLIKLTVTNELDNLIANYFMSLKQVLFFFDGLNELSNDAIERVLKIFKQIKSEGYKIWISCTNTLKNKLVEDLYKSQFYSFQEITEKDQENYILEKFKNHQVEAKYMSRKLLTNKNSKNYNLLKNPLFLYILTENIDNKKNVISSKKTLHLGQIYSSFIDGKIKHNFAKANLVISDNQFTKEVFSLCETLHINNYKTAALKTCLEPYIFEKLSVRVEKTFHEKIKSLNDMFGFVKVNEDNTYTFIHQTFTEYFAALWLSENFNSIPNEIRNFMFDARYEGIRQFFDAGMAENCPLHIAVLEQNFLEVKNYITLHLNNLDRGGRSVLHIAVSNGKSYPILNKLPTSNLAFQFDYNYYKTQKTILKYLLSQNSLDLSMKDTFLKCDVFQYADACLSFHSLDVILESTNCHHFQLKETLKHPLTLFYYCIRMGYINLFKLAIKLFDETFLQSQPFLHLALQYNQKIIAEMLIKLGTNIEALDNLKQSPLHKASMWGREDMARLLIKKNCKIEARDTLGKSALHYAAKMGHLEVVKLLVENGAKVDGACKFGKTPLHKAAYWGRTKVVEYLVEKGANVNSQIDDLWLRTALQRAAETGKDDIVRFLVDHGAEVNIVDRNRRTALHYAAYEGHIKVVEILANLKTCKILAKNDDNMTAKEVARHRGHKEVVEILDKAEKLNTYKKQEMNRYQSPLHEAARVGDLATIKKLLSQGKDIEETAKNQETILHIAAFNGHEHLVHYLLKLGANIYAKNQDDRLPLHLACQNGNIKVIRLLNRKELLTVGDRWGLTPLHRAAHKDHLETIKVLLNSGVDINVMNDEGGTALHSAAKGGNYNIIEYLISNGAEIGRKNYKGKTCLHLAVERGNTECVKFLLKKNKDIVNETDIRERTALHWAVERGYKSMVESLLEAGADVNALDEYRNSPLDIAQLEKRSDIIEFLQNHQLD